MDLICDIAGVTPTAAHAWHVVLHAGLAGLVSTVGAGYLALGLIVRHRRPR